MWDGLFYLKMKAIKGSRGQGFKGSSGKYFRLPASDP